MKKAQARKHKREMKKAQARKHKREMKKAQARNEESTSETCFPASRLYSNVRSVLWH